MSQAHHPGLLFDSAPCAGHARAIGRGSTQLSTSEESGYARAQDCDATHPALLREEVCIDTQKTKSLAAQQQALLPLSAPLPRRLYPTKSCARQPVLMQR